MARRSKERARETERREGEEGMGASSLIIVFPAESISTFNHFQFVV